VKLFFSSALQSRAGLLLGLVLGPIAGLAAAPNRTPFDFAVLSGRAKQLAAAPYVPRVSQVPAQFRRLTYDQHRDIRFRPEETWWRKDGLPFQLQFFHPGFIYDQTVQIFAIANGQTTPILFDSRLFDYGKNHIHGEVPKTMGFSGLKILFPLNRPNYFDELAVFQGASYFRALGAGLRYGLSARGLAIDTAAAGPEEFPLFEDFWIERPAPTAKQIVVYALLNSPSVAGAYRFAIDPGADTVMQVRATLYFRTNPGTAGLAPLTSMFWHGENTTAAHGDFRPEVHDSDGLAIQTGSGEWLWRPLVNPKAVRTSAFADENPRGFGLFQRDRNFEDYQDLEAAYQLRPSAWVEPVGNWGRGSVRLVELSTPDETNDNIVAFWVPEKLPAPGEPLSFEYRLHWFRDQIHPPAGYVVSTRLGRSMTHEPELERFVVDFAGSALKKQKPDAQIEPVVTVGRGAKLAHATLEKNPYNDTWRVAFSLRPDGSGQPVELRCFLRQSARTLTETWTYLWQP
jgi:glucans biosynthesis protein